ncbi:MAG: bifunctional [glutamate--ammonia ligase]-adenylyl-L-tyrosine phosphorylase/[glutamate--ammonia-ligase] adenylyltransferase [Gammaproteobacteria bacterium]|nr:bifunctional [glutamate--ammonia ligase]-adenylyl-L-tyrosine phosphorylase/[glutamate--ammonia-ligase] adenylyltransferase [Gammaproteobacteria bacterium]
MSITDISVQLDKYPSVLHGLLKNYWSQWSAACQRDDFKPDDCLSADTLLDIFCCSDFIARHITHSPSIARALIQSGDLNASRTAMDYQQILSEKIKGVRDDLQLMSLLRQFRQYEMIRIAWRDLVCDAATTQTLQELSWLADACIKVTLEALFLDSCEKIGVPQNPAGKTLRPLVVGMGKLGAYELNFSSDIDLIFFYSERGETAGKRTLDNSEFFTRLMQRFITMLNKITVDGFVFRVDTRLRPFGDSGPLVMSFAGLENYYQTQGRSWERYAMIKGRAIYGDIADIDELTQILKPFVFRRYLDFGAFSSIRKMKSLIDNQINSKGLQHNIKLGEGGIREIEFIGQTFQLIRGGRKPELQIRGIVDVLKLLAELNDLPGQTVQHLLESYEYLRRLENRLQMLNDEQTHLLPKDEVSQARICHTMKIADWAGLLEQTWFHRKRVHSYFEMVFESPQLSDGTDTGETGFYHALWVGQLDEETALEKLTERGFYQAKSVWQQVNDFSTSKTINHIGDTARKRLDELMPMILAAIEQQQKPEIVLSRLLEVVNSVLKRSVYLALLIEYPMALTQLIRLCAASVLITKLLTRYPLLLDDLLDPSQLYHLPGNLEMEQELDIAASRYDDNDLEQQMDVLRHFKHSHILRIAALDVAGDLDAFAISSQLSLLAEIILHRVYQMALIDTVEKFGRPVCQTDEKKYFPELAIIAYGKLGGQELGYNSDLDIVFLHNSVGQYQMTDGTRSVDNSVFFAKMTQRVIHILSSYTNAGRLYEVDTRLRPDGAKGLLVSSLSAFEQYQQKQAWTWEHQALLRARIVVTNSQISYEFDRIRRSVLCQDRDQLKLLDDVRDMRAKMRSHLGSDSNTEQFQLKQDAGGLVDIEFIVQFAVLSNAAQQPELVSRYSTIELISLLAELKCWTEERARMLTDCYRYYRDLSHQRALDEETLLFDESEISVCRDKVKAVWLEVLNEEL